MTSLPPCVNTDGDVIVPHSDDVMFDDVMSLLVPSAAVIVADDVTAIDVMTSLNPVIVDKKASSSIDIADVISDVIVDAVPVSATPVDQHLHYSSVAALKVRHFSKRTVSIAL